MRLVANKRCQVGNEFGSIEALWSQFENVMAKDPDAEREQNGTADESNENETEPDGIEHKK